MKSRELASALYIAAALIAGGKPTAANPILNGQNSVLTESSEAGQLGEFTYTKGPEIVINEGGIVGADGSDKHNTVLVRLDNVRLVVVDRENPEARKIVLDGKDDSIRFTYPMLSSDGTKVIITESLIDGQTQVLRGTRIIDIATGEHSFLEAFNPNASSRVYPLDNGDTAIVEIDVGQSQENPSPGDALVTTYGDDLKQKAQRVFPFELTSVPSGVYRQTVHELGENIFFLRGSSSYLLGSETLETIKRSEFGYDTMGVPSNSYVGPRASVIKELGLILNVDPTMSRMINFDFAFGDYVEAYKGLDILDGIDPRIVGKGRFDRFYGAWAGLYRPLAVDRKAGTAYFAGAIITNPEARTGKIEWGMGVLKVSDGGKRIETLRVPHKSDGIGIATAYGDGGVVIRDPHTLTTLRVSSKLPGIYLPTLSK